jgi:hypothetical protein
MNDDFEAMARAAFVGEVEPMLAQLEADLLGIPVLRPQGSVQGLGCDLVG